MGGINSGRQSERVAIERAGCLVLDVNVAVKGIKPGRGRRGVWQWSLGGRLVQISTAVILDRPCEDEGLMQVTHGDVHGFGIAAPSDYAVHLDSTLCHLGGRRWWFMCPQTGVRCGKLYLPRGGVHFLSRHAYRLVYDVQRESPLGRAHRRLARAYRTVGIGYHGGERGQPPRPKGMHAATFDRITCRLSDAQGRLDGISTVDLSRLLELRKAVPSTMPEAA